MAYGFSRVGVASRGCPEPTERMDGMKLRFWMMGLAGILACATGAVAITYYVDDNSNDGDVYTPGFTGNDSNSGTTNTAPKLTLNNLLATYTLSPGDVVLIDTGIYTNNVMIGTNVNGTAINRIVFQGSPDTRPWGGGTVFTGGGDLIDVRGNYLLFQDLRTIGAGSGFNLTGASFNEFERIYSISNSSHALKSSGASNSNVFRRCVFHSTSVAAHGMYAPARNNYIEFCIAISDNSVGIGGHAGVISNVFSCILIGKTGIAPPEDSAGSRNVISRTDRIHPSIETLSDFNRIFTNWSGNTVADPKFVNADGFDFHLLSAAGFVSNGVWVTNATVGFSPGIDFGPRE